jgi:hypothetical protein
LFFFTTFFLGFSFSLNKWALKHLPLNKGNKKLLWFWRSFFGFGFFVGDGFEFSFRSAGPRFFDDGSDNRFKK